MGGYYSTEGGTYPKEPCGFRYFDIPGNLEDYPRVEISERRHRLVSLRDLKLQLDVKTQREITKIRPVGVNFDLYVKFDNGTRVSRKGSLPFFRPVNLPLSVYLQIDPSPEDFVIISRECADRYFAV